MGQKLTHNNPNIADLSDKNRPTKLAERYTELYDNQWTDAYELIDAGDEMGTIPVLLDVLYVSIVLPGELYHVYQLGRLVKCCCTIDVIGGVVGVLQHKCIDKCRTKGTIW